MMTYHAQFLLLVVAGWVNRQQQDVIDYLQEANRVLRAGLRGKRLKLSDDAFHMALRRMNRSDCTPHGFRSSFRDWAAERTNVPREVCEAALAHTLRDKTEAAYNRTDLFEQRRKLMNLWAVSSGRTGDGKRVAGKRTDNPSLQQVVSSRR